MDVLRTFNVNTLGSGTQPMLFAHGYGCDQNMWRYIVPAFEQDYRVVLFDYAGFGKSNPSAYDRSRHRTLSGYAADVLNICAALDLQRIVFVGHSVSAMIGILAAIDQPQRFDKLVLLGPSPSYINDGSYVGGFTRSDIEAMLDTVDSNYLGWASSITPLIMGNPDRPALAEELKNSFCRAHPEIARAFARTTFLSDNRGDLAKVRTPSLVVQCSNDVIAPLAVGEYVHKHLPNSEYVLLSATGHCPNLSAPEETVRAMKRFLART